MVKKRKILLFVLFAIFGSSHAFADRGVGNGGGIWVCRNQDGAQSVRWVQLVDLFEAKAEFYLEIRKAQDSDETQLQSALDRIKLASPTFFGSLRPFVDQVSANWPKGGESELKVVDDSLYTRIPDRKNCPSGTLAYEQAVNFTPDNGIQVNQDLYRQLSSTNRAALKLHEAVYAMLRSMESTTDSRKSRKIVAYVFSTQDPLSYSNLLTVQPPHRKTVYKLVTSTDLPGGIGKCVSPVEWTLCDPRGCQSMKTTCARLSGDGRLEVFSGILQWYLDIYNARYFNFQSSTILLTSVPLKDRDLSRITSFMQQQSTPLFVVYDLVTGDLSYGSSLDTLFPL